MAEGKINDHEVHGWRRYLGRILLPRTESNTLLQAAVVFDPFAVNRQMDIPSMSAWTLLPAE